MEKKIHLGYRYKLKISDGQKSFLDHHMFIYNQAYNICLNLWLKENEKNKKQNLQDLALAAHRG